MSRKSTHTRKGKIPDLGIAPQVAPPFAAWRPDAGQQREIDLGDARIVLALWYDGGQLVDFVLMLDGLLDDEWCPVLRFDCCHGEVHMHRFDSSGEQEIRQVLRTINLPADIQLGYDVANEQLFDQWEANIRRWQGGK